MAVVASSLVSSTLSRGSSGWQANVDYLVKDAPTLFAAMNAVGIAQGTAHPEISGIFALDFAARHEAEQSQVMRVTVGYRAPQNTTADEDPPAPPFSGGTTQISTRVQPREEAKDASGTQITVEVPAGTGKITDVPVTQPALVEVFRPSTVLTIERTEDEDPLTLAQTYVGKVNTGTFANGAAGTWLCTAIEGQSEDQGVTYTVAYEFEYRVEGWKVTVSAIDEKTGRPIDGLVDGVSIKDFTVYDSVSFSTLNLGV